MSLIYTLIGTPTYATSAYLICFWLPVSMQVLTRAVKALLAWYIFERKPELTDPEYWRREGYLYKG